MSANEIFSYQTFVQAASGATGSVSAQLLTMPLTTSFTRAQLEDDSRKQGPIETIVRIFKEEGIHGVYKGGVSTCLCIAVSNFVYFYSFHALKKTRKQGEQKPITDLFYACIAGCLNVLITNPIWVVNSRLRMAGINENSIRYKGQLDGLIRIYKEEGIKALWNGTKASLMLVSNPAIKFTVYEFLKRKLIKLGSGGQLTANRAFLIGALSTAVATILTYPLQMVQAKARNSKEQMPMKNIAVDIFRKSGLAGFFHGLDSKLLQAMLASGFMFLAYEKIAYFVLKLLTVYHAKK